MDEAHTENQSHGENLNDSNHVHSQRLQVLANIGIALRMYTSFFVPIFTLRTAAA